MKRIELTEPHEHDGRVRPAGDVIELDDTDADWLVSLKKAKAAASNPKPAAHESTQTKEHTA